VLSLLHPPNDRSDRISEQQTPRQNQHSLDTIGALWYHRDVCLPLIVCRCEGPFEHGLVWLGKLGKLGKPVPNKIAT